MARPSKSNPEGKQKSPKKTQDAIAKLLEWFRYDFTIENACAYAWIDVSTYHRRKNKDKKLNQEIESAKHWCSQKAKIAVHDKLNDWEFALKRLSKRENKIYSERNETETKTDITMNRKEMSIEEIEEVMRKFTSVK